MVQRQVPKPADIFELLQFKKFEFNGRKRRLASALTVHDLRRIAKRRTPAAAFDYTDGAADDELSLRRARQAFEDIEFHPSILRDVSHVDTTAQILGGPSALPFGIAPTGFTRLMQTEGEVAGAGAAGAAGIPFTLSTLGTSSIETVKEANPHGRNWFQLYVMNQRHISFGLVERAAEAGFDALFFTVDTPIAGARLRDKRNGFSIPPQISLRTVANAIPRPWWWWDFITTPKLEFASLSSTGGTVGELLNAAMDPSINFDDLAEIRKIWPNKIAIKGVQNVEDAKRLADLGVDAIVLSNHGGRQLDRAPATIDVLEEVVQAVAGHAEVYLDGGVRRGTDVLVARALGAQGVLVGRPWIYALAAGGEQGIARLVALMRAELETAMRLLGVTRLDAVTRAHVRSA